MKALQAFFDDVATPQQTAEQIDQVLEEYTYLLLCHSQDLPDCKKAERISLLKELRQRMLEMDNE